MLPRDKGLERGGSSWPVLLGSDGAVLKGLTRPPRQGEVRDSRVQSRQRKSSFLSTSGKRLRRRQASGLAAQTAVRWGQRSRD